MTCLIVIKIQGDKMNDKDKKHIHDQIEKLHSDLEKTWAAIIIISAVIVISIPLLALLIWGIFFKL